MAVDLKKWNEISIHNCYTGESGEYFSHRQCCFTLKETQNVNVKPGPSFLCSGG